MSLLSFIDKENKGNSNKNHNNNDLLFQEVCELFEQLQTTRSTLEKEDMIRIFLEKKKEIISNTDFNYFYQISSKDLVNLDFDKETGVSIGIFLETVSKFLKLDLDELKLRYKGDWGETVQKYFSKTKIKRISGALTVQEVIKSIFNLTEFVGSGSKRKKQTEITSILKKSTSIEAKYYTRLILGGSLKTGAKDKLIQKAYFSCFRELENISKNIEYANKTRRLNFGQAIQWYLDGEKEKILNLTMKPGYPVSLMLAERGLVDVVTQGPHFIEYKYDGFRLQAHFDGKKVFLFSRGLEDHTENLPDIVRALKETIKHTYIVDGEILAYNKETGSVLPFQSIIRRKRKYDREEIAKTMHTEYRIFDVLYFEGKDVTEKSLKKRRLILEKMLQDSSVIKLSKMIETQDSEEALNFIHKAKEAGHEGGILKNTSSPYLIGERDKSWTKIKPQTYDMDGVLIGGQYGTGKRAGMISRVFIAFPDSDSDNYESLGVAVGSGMSEDLMKSLKKLFDEDGVTECPYNVKIEPDLTNQVNIWIYPEKGPVLEIVADSFSWRKNIPKTVDGSRFDLTKISLRFPRCKGRREIGKKPNSIQEVNSLIQSQIASQETEK
jgi:DNA ligase-1